MNKDIMIDISNRKSKPIRHTLNRCHFCDHEKYPFGKVLFNDKYAIKTEKGYKCGECANQDTRKLLRMFGSE